MAKEPDDNEQFEIKPAIRHAVPQIMSIYGVTFSGKTFGALMVAAGLVEPGELIGMIDTENARGVMYADDPDVRRAIPKESWVNGAPYVTIELHPPFHPKRYIMANRALERHGCRVIITDSGSHAWEGEGGGLDMKESDKGWKNGLRWWSGSVVWPAPLSASSRGRQSSNKREGRSRTKAKVPNSA